jgi:hypothetical protein
LNAIHSNNNNIHFIEPKHTIYNNYCKSKDIKRNSSNAYTEKGKAQTGSQYSRKYNKKIKLIAIIALLK